MRNEPKTTAGRGDPPASERRLVGYTEPTRQDMDELTDDLLLLAADAREDFAVFFEFVMREEKTHQPVKTAPHQSVAAQFIEAHDRCVLMMPVGHSKTFLLVAYTLWTLGRNSSLRGAIVSATQGQAEKVVGMVRDYVERSQELHLVFPDLRKSTREGDHWTQTHLVIDRPHGIRDPSLVAIGMDGAIEGSRLNWVIVDDLLKADNTRTKDARAKVKKWVDTSVISRLDPLGEKLVFSNTPWHPDDLVMSMFKAGWATLRMDAAGYIFIQDDIERRRAAEEDGVDFIPWDSPELRPATPDPDDESCRLIAHDPDPDNQVTLWPERIDRKQLQKMERTANDRSAFLATMMTICRDDGAAWCKDEWIETCKRNARDVGAYKMVAHYDVEYIHGIAAKLASTPRRKVIHTGERFQVFTGVDLAFSQKAKSDDTCYFTFVVMPTGHRLILEIETGKFPTPTVMRKVLQKWGAFGSIVTVENNGAQRAIRDFALKENVAAPIKAFTTGNNKANVDYGLPSIFVEIENAAWIIPNDKHGAVHPMVQRWIDGLMNYTPDHHTADELMAMFFAREQARKFGMLSGGETAGLSDFNSR